jgi:hypothetical protein
VELSPCWEAASCAATQELPSILWNPNVHYHVRFEVSRRWLWRWRLPGYDAVWLRDVLRLLVTANVVPSSPILVSLMVEVIRSSQTSVPTGATRRDVQEDDILHRSLLCSQGPSNGPYLDSAKSIPYHPILSLWRPIWLLYTHLSLGPLVVSFFPAFPPVSYTRMR